MLFAGLVGLCPWHEKDSSFREVHQVHQASPDFVSPHTPYTGPLPAIRVGLRIIECMHCKKSVVLLETEVRGVGGDPTTARMWRTMVSPGQSPRSLDESAPERVKSLFAEASKCETAGAMRGAGVLLRAAVEELAKAQGATGRNLYSKIDSLKDRLPSELIADLHEARMLGNDSIHDGLVYSADEVADVAGLIEEAVLVLYVQPEEKRLMREARKSRRHAAKAAGER